MPPPVIETCKLGKRYRRGTRALYHTLREDLTLGARRLFARGGAAGDDKRWLWALRDLDLRVEQGEILGIVGSNGAGKSTLLKLLAGITDPSAGHADLDGRVGSLLEVGTGFHMELTGRENIYLAGAILGMRRDEIQKSFDAIVDFAGVEDFLDTPIKHFSSGMHTRLGFSVAAHLACEILLVDEVLAVGDAAFQRRCLGRMGELAGQGRTVLFVSHNLASVQTLCGRAIRLEQGKLVDDGAVGEVVRGYLQSIGGEQQASLVARTDRTGGEHARLVAVQVASTDPDGMIRPTSQLRLSIDYEADSPLRDCGFTATVYDLTETGLFVLSSATSPDFPRELPARGRVVCQTAALRLTPGRCFINLRVLFHETTLDYVPRAIFFDVEALDVDGSGRLPGREWMMGMLPNAWRLAGDER